jgi:hypothetical protein
VAKLSSDDLAFEHWVEWVFDHPVTKPEWYEDEDVELWINSPVVTIDYLTRLFAKTTVHLHRYSDTQANQGLWFLASSISFDGLSSLFGQGVLGSQRQRCISAMGLLFEHYFANRCTSHLSHIDEPDANPLNATCYMWWDFIAHWADSPEGRIGSEMDSEILATMEQILKLNHDACRESALHGLGHWHHFCPAEVATIIDRFLAPSTNLRPELHTYALNARTGHVL